MKRIICLCLCILLLVGSSSQGVFCASLSNENNYQKEENKKISQDEAVSIALLFIAGNTEYCRWSQKTQIDTVIPLYNEKEEICNYYVALQEDGKKQGYVIVTAEFDKPLISEFSDEAEIPVYDERNVASRTSIASLSQENRIYYGSAIASTVPCVSCEGEYFNSVEQSKQYREASEAVVEFIHTNNLLLSTNCSYGLIASPVAYIQAHYPGYTYTKVNSVTVSGTIASYSINDWNGCVVYATAAIIKFYKPTFDYSAIVNKCKTIARTNGYASNSSGSWNYWISVSDTAPFIRDCLSAYSLSKTVKDTILLSSAVTEICNNRPCLFNIWKHNSQTINHTVLVYGWDCYYLSFAPDSISTINFYLVKDGDCTSQQRYVCDAALLGVFVTRIY